VAAIEFRAYVGKCYNDRILSGWHDDGRVVTRLKIGERVARDKSAAREID
jgi:hypothetical protein